MTARLKSASKGAPPEAARSYALSRRLPTAPAPGPLGVEPALGNQAVQRLLKAGAIQAKLTIGSPGDPLEQEADRAADQAMRAPAPRLQRKCDCANASDAHGECEDCRNKRLDEAAEAPVIRRRATTGESHSEAPSIVHETLDGAGRPLDSATRTDMEGRFGADFGAVRIHTGSQAAQSAEAVGALAYTVGADIAFGAGRYAPHSDSGRRLLAHELAHVAQNPEADAGLLRQTKPDASTQDDDSDGISGPEPQAAQKPPDPNSIAVPEPNGESLGEIEGISLVADREYIFARLERLAATKGTDAPGDFYAALEADIAADKRRAENDPNNVDVGTPEPNDAIQAKTRVLAVVESVARELEQMEESFLAEFEQRARDTALNVLAANEKEARAEAFRYGLVADKMTVQKSDCLFGDCTEEVTRYSMGEQSSAVSGLQAAAKILLPRRRAFDKAKEELDAARDDEMECDYGCDSLPERTTAAEEELEKTAASFQLPLGYLGQRYPILNAFADPERSADDLEALSKPQDSQTMAKRLGKEIFTRLENIATVRDKIDELNIWQLPVLVGLVRTQTEADTDPFFSRVANEVVDYNKPGWLETIALLVLNIGALLLAGPTGGGSLVIAAGVNAAVAIEHTKEYLLKKALAGTAFDRAKGLSMEDPSLLWLAVEWIGVGLDVGAAFKAVSTAVKAVEVATDAGDLAKRAKALDDLEKLGEEAGGKTKQAVEFAVEHLRTGAAEESALGKAAGLAEEEVGALKSAEDVAEKELEAGTASGRAVEDSVVKNAKISRAGHIFSCASPCTWMREKYAALLGPEMIDKQPNLLRGRYLDLEDRAAKAAENVQLAEKAGKTAQEIAEAKRAVDALEIEIGAFDKELAKELGYRTGLEKLGALAADQSGRLAAMDRELVTRLAELPSGAAKRMMGLAPEALTKFGALGADEFGKIARLGERSLQKLAALESGVLAKLAKLEPASLSYVAELNPAAIEWLSELSPRQLEKIAAARVRSPYSLRKLAEGVGPNSTMKEIDQMLAKAERHRAQLEKAFEAVESGDWSKIPDKASVGRHLGYEIEEVARAIGSGGYAKTILHYAEINKKVIAELEKSGGRAMITQGRLLGGDLRFDIAVINFDKKTVELIDMVATADKAHLGKTLEYVEQLEKILPKDFTFLPIEMRYVDAEGKVVEALEEAVAK